MYRDDVHVIYTSGKPERRFCHFDLKFYVVNEDGPPLTPTEALVHFCRETKGLFIYHLHVPTSHVSLEIIKETAQWRVRLVAIDLRDLGSVSQDLVKR